MANKTVKGFINKNGDIITIETTPYNHTHGCEEIEGLDNVIESKISESLENFVPESDSSKMDKVVGAYQKIAVFNLTGQVESGGKTIDDIITTNSSHAFSSLSVIITNDVDHGIIDSCSVNDENLVNGDIEYVAGMLDSTLSETKYSIVLLKIISINGNVLGIIPSIAWIERLDPIILLDSSTELTSLYKFFTGNKEFRISIRYVARAESWDLINYTWINHSSIIL